MNKKPYKILELAGRHVAGVRNPGVGNSIMLTEQQAKLALDKGEIKLDKVMLAKTTPASEADPEVDDDNETKAPEKTGKKGGGKKSKTADDADDDKKADDENTGD